MSIAMEEDIKRWTARRKSALVLEIIQGKTAVSAASRQFDIPPSEIEDWIDQAKAGMENALKAKPEDVRAQYERLLKDLKEAYGEAMLELRARKYCSPSPEAQQHRGASGNPVRATAAGSRLLGRGAAVRRVERDPITKVSSGFGLSDVTPHVIMNDGHRGGSSRRARR